MPAVAVDGVNVLAVHEAVKRQWRARATGGGPTFIEVPVYRFRAHGGAGDDSRTGYRDQAERARGSRSIRSLCSREYLTRLGCSTDVHRRRWSANRDGDRRGVRVRASQPESN